MLDPYVFFQAFPSNKFPFAEFLVAFGFLIILSIEQIAVDCNDKSSDCRNPIERLQSINSQLERETLTTNAQVRLATIKIIVYHSLQTVISQTYV